MTTTTTTPTVKREIKVASPTRQRVMGIVFLVIGFGIWFLFSRDVEAGTYTKFGMTTGGQVASIPDLTVPTLATLNILAVVCGVLGVIQLVRKDGFGK